MDLGSENWGTLFRADVLMVMPEIWLVIGMCAVLLVPFFNRDSRSLPTFAAAGAVFIALLATLVGLPSGPNGEGFRAVFGGALAIDPFSQFFKAILLLFTLLIIAQWMLISRDRVDVRDMPDFLCLLLGATFGMMLMASANNLLMLFIAAESASIPSFALAGFLKRDRLSTEGSLKYVLFGAASSAIMLYGMSLVYATTGTIYLAGIAAQVVEHGSSPLFIVGMMGMFVGFAFKLSAVPLHFWTPDVFQAAPVEVTTFLSVASKGAAIAMLVRVLQSFGAAAGTTDVFLGLTVGVGILGAATATWGNLVALRQTHIRRMLAYSSIGHAGYMLLACAVIPITDGTAVAGAILFYLLVYAFMNLGAFTLAAVITQRTGSEDIRDYAGLFQRSPLLSSMMIVFLLSLFGMPGLGGFVAKFMLMGALAKAGVTGFVLMAFLLLNTLISLYYYLRPGYYMVFVKDETGNRPAVSPQGPAWAMLALCVVMLFWTGLLAETATRITQDYSAILSPRAAQRAMVEPIELQTVTPLLDSSRAQAH